ncbi:MAG: TetR/AcrR family transcriptional regulator [Actinobacteria bacterium]|nr:TetR/AcrR family transcriptional regulator [Actinomycetota bacterium]
MARAARGRPARLSRDTICQAALDLLADTDAATFSLRALGDRLGVDATAIYRHFHDKDDLLREVGDRALAPVTRGFTTSADARDDIRRMCTRLRKTMLRSQVALTLTAFGPTRRGNELRITEVMLDALSRCGLSEEETVMAYHVLIEYTIGSATLDGPLAAPGADRRGTYRTWRADYAGLPVEQYPTSVRMAQKLYPSSDVVFAAGLDALIAGLTGRQ